MLEAHKLKMRCKTRILPSQGTLKAILLNFKMVAGVFCFCVCIWTSSTLGQVTVILATKRVKTEIHILKLTWELALHYFAPWSHISWCFKISMRCEKLQRKRKWEERMTISVRLSNNPVKDTTNISRSKNRTTYLIFIWKFSASHE